MEVYVIDIIDVADVSDVLYSHISHISHIRNSYYRKRLVDELEVVEVEQRAVTADEVVAVA